MENTEEKKWCVYIHTSPSNKAYIGITSKDVKDRWGVNGWRYKTQNEHFWRAICKYGWENFEHNILFENLTKEMACKIEILLIALFDTQNPECGYNISPGGDLGFTGCKLSDEAKQKISEANKGRLVGEKNPMYGISPQERMDDITYATWKEKLIDLTTSDEFRQQCRDRNVGKKYSDEVNKKKGKKGIDHPMYGKHHSDETKQKLREANTGRIQSEETRSKISDALMGEKNPFYGKTHSEESKKKMSESRKGKPAWNKGVPMSDAQKVKLSESRKGKPLSNETRAKMSESRKGAKNSTARKVVQYDKYGNFIRVWDYIKQVSEVLNINRCSIGDCCRGKQKTAGGFIWRYFSEEDFNYAESVGF